MRIAVTYDNGEIFQHFGHTESFKLYDVEDDDVLSSEVFATNGSGHDALAGLLEEHDIDVLICGGLGDGAMNALTSAGIEVVAGVDGSADKAVKAYIKGELVSTGVNCDHHNHEEEDACGCGGGCGGGCSGCGGGCGAPAMPVIEGPNVGKTCNVHYTGTFNDGTVFDSSLERGETLEFVCGVGMMIRGFDEAVANMNVGEKIKIHLMPEDAYGPVDPDNIVTVDLANLEGTDELNVGDGVYLYDQMGRPHQVTVIEKTETTITFDANHEMAGKELNFEIELVSVDNLIK